GQHLHRRVLEVSRADAEDGQEDARVLFPLDEMQQIVVTDDTDVEVSVGGENDAVDAARNEGLARDAVGHDEPLPPVGGTAGRQAGNGALDDVPAARWR